MADLPPVLGYRFGIFEADPLTGELRRQGLRVKLHAQPFQVLSLLLQRPGELLTREEIARELWPDGTFVDADHGVHSAVNRIREALGDTARSPRFVETLARRGYRFIAPVEQILPASPPLEDPAHHVVAPAPPVLAPASPEQASFPPDRIPAAAGSRGLLASSHDLPLTSPAGAATLFSLLQLMYLAFYISALANLGEVGDLLASLPHSEAIFWLTIASAATLIPLRAFLLCAALFRPPQLQQRLMKLWPLLLLADQLWALSPFLLLRHISFGLAFACTTLLVYAPFAQRSLLLMGAVHASADA